MKKFKRRSETIWSNALWLILWFVVVAIGLLSRDILPVDETRYLGVAWEMWRSENWLVPQMNGEPYSHKPPLLFWLILAGWELLGVNDWWPRLIPAIFALGSGYLARVLAKQLWPSAGLTATAIPIVLQGTLLWTIFTGLLMFDMLVTFFVLLALLCLLRLAQGGRSGYWLLFGVTIGLSFLTKGPVSLLYIMPAALAVPWWAKLYPRSSWLSWYFALFGACLLGIAIAILWAVPAGLQGGSDYARDILVGQTTSRISAAPVPHSRPFYWYLMLLPVVLFPWALLPAAWAGMSKAFKTISDPGIRFCFTWFLPAIVILSLIESKQAHYLIPLAPGILLSTLRGIELAGLRPPSRLGVWCPSILILALGIIMWGASASSEWMTADGPIQKLSPGWGLALIFCSLSLFLFPKPETVQAIQRWSATTVVLVVVLLAGPLQTIVDSYDTRILGRFLSRVQTSGVQIAWVNAYNNQVHYYGRLHKPLTVLDGDEITQWTVSNPTGVVVVRYRDDSAFPPDAMLYQQSWRGGYIAILPANYYLESLVSRE